MTSDELDVFMVEGQRGIHSYDEVWETIQETRETCIRSNALRLVSMGFPREEVSARIQLASWEVFSAWNSEKIAFIKFFTSQTLKRKLIDIQRSELGYRLHSHREQGCRVREWVRPEVPSEIHPDTIPNVVTNEFPHVPVEHIYNITGNDEIRLAVLDGLITTGSYTLTLKRLTEEMPNSKQIIERTGQDLQRDLATYLWQAHPELVRGRVRAKFPPRRRIVVKINR